MTASISLPADTATIDYSLRWRVQSVYPGSHRGSGGAASGIFRGLIPFERAPDIRRLDLRRSMRDPFEQWYVREYQPRVSVPVYALVDVSASMAWRDGESSKLTIAAEFCDILARSTHRNGDSFGLYACGKDVHEESSLLSTRNRAGANDIIDRLSRVRPADDSAAGLTLAAEYLSGTRKLVFLISDFLFPYNQIEEALATLAFHDVIPVVLEDNSVSMLPEWGFTDLADLESGQRRFVILRPSLKRRWLDQAENRRAHLDSIFRQYVNRPFGITHGLDIEALNTYLLER